MEFHDICFWILLFGKSALLNVMEIYTAQEQSSTLTSAEQNLWHIMGASKHSDVKYNIR